MRWLRDKLLGRQDEERTITKFLLFPKKIGNEWRWLEKASIHQRVERIDVGGSMEYGRYKHRWIDRNWEEEL